MRNTLARPMAALVLASGIGLLTWTNLPRRQQDFRPADRGSCSTKGATGPGVRSPGPSPEEIQRQVRAKAIPLLDSADQETHVVIGVQVASVDQFFAEVKQRIPKFTEDVLGFSSQWRLVADHLPLIGGQRHHLFLRNLFDESLLAEEQLQAKLQSAVDGYLQGERDIEDQLLVKLRRDLASFHEQVRFGELDKEAVRAVIARTLNEASGHAMTNLKAELAREMGALVVGELLTQVVMRSALRGTLACSGLMSWGVGLAACLAADHALGLARDRWLDPTGKLTEAMTKNIDDLHSLAIEGRPGCPGLRPRLEGLARQRGALRREVILQSFQTRGAD